MDDFFGLIEPGLEPKRLRPRIVIDLKMGHGGERESCDVKADRACVACVPSPPLSSPPTFAVRRCWTSCLRREWMAWCTALTRSLAASFLMVWYSSGQGFEPTWKQCGERGFSFVDPEELLDKSVHLVSLNPVVGHVPSLLFQKAIPSQVPMQPGGNQSSQLCSLGVEIFSVVSILKKMRGFFFLGH